MPSTVFFDVNETLADLSILVPSFTQVGASAELPTTWFSSTLRDGFALTMTTGEKTFQDVAEQVLAGLLSREPNLVCSVADGVTGIMDSFTNLPVHPDVVRGISALADAGHRLITLSNGSVNNSRALLERAGILPLFDMTLSVDDAGAWKPDPRSYAYALEQADVDASRAALVAVHPWDLHGAHQAGLTTVFLDRTGDPWPSVFTEPDLRVTVLNELHLP